MLDFDFEEILIQVKQKQVVPIIGEDMFVHVKSDGQEESLQTYIVNSFLTLNGVVARPFDENLKERAINEGYHGLTILFNHSIYKDYSRKRTKFDSVIEKIVYDEIDKIHLKHNVRTFLKIGIKHDLFPLIITTSPFDIIERDLGYDIQDPKYPNQDPKKAKNSIYFSLSDSNLSPIKENCIYHLFGCASDRTSIWASNERKMINFLHALHITPVRFPLKQIITDKKLFVMGCSLPNWMFRFLLFPLNSEQGYWIEDSTSISREKKSNHDQLGKIQLEEYLEDLCYTKGNAEEIISVLQRDLESLPIEGEESSEENKEYDFFVSHDTRDTDFAKTIVTELRKQGSSVWVDYEHEGDLIGNDWSQIKEALEHSRHIIPLITAKYIQRFTKLFAEPQNVKTDSMEWITLVLLEFMKPTLLAGSVEKKIDDSFVIPIMKIGDVIRKNITVTNAYIQSQIDSGNIPDQFSCHRYFAYPEGLEASGGNNFLNQNWEDIGKKGKTLIRLGIRINNLLSISDELKNVFE